MSNPLYVGFDQVPRVSCVRSVEFELLWYHAQQNSAVQVERVRRVRKAAMTTMTLDLPAELYQRLQEEAIRVGRPVDDLVTAWLQERLAPPKGERERTIEILRAAGMLAEPSTEMKARAAQAPSQVAPYWRVALSVPESRPR